MPDAPPTTAAERQRLTSAERQRDYRRRVRENLLIGQSEMPPSLAEGLVASGLLDKAAASDARERSDAQRRDDTRRRGAALVTAAERYLRDAR